MERQEGSGSGGRQLVQSQTLVVLPLPVTALTPETDPLPSVATGGQVLVEMGRGRLVGRLPSVQTHSESFRSVVGDGPRQWILPSARRGEERRIDLCEPIERIGITSRP